MPTKLASAAGKSLSFARHTADWHDITADPDIGLVNITAPNALHKEIALQRLQRANMFIAKNLLHQPCRMLWK